MTNPYTPEKVAELVAKLGEAAKRAEYFQTGEEGLLRRSADALTAVSAERDAAIREMHARELHHFEEEQISANQAHNLRVLMADRDRLHKAITEALRMADAGLYANVHRILQAALDKEGNDDE
ncbi:hypothetical protein [Microbacterium aerolatum]|uniref:hypothetical protein n=1 Tax=Microbacterium aerolatum TaxID=153731 RepID=UPI00384E048C